MAGAGGSSSRLLRATAKAFKEDSSNHKSSTAAAASGNSTTGPYRIPSLKFPFPWADASNKNKTHGGRTGSSSRRAAEQRSALIGIGGAAGVSPPSSEKKKLGGVFLSDEEARSVDLLLPLAYEIARRLILRQFGATWVALHRACWSRVAETMIHRTIVSCQSFTLIGVAGSLLGSVPCFVKGCVLVVASFLMRFRTMSHAADPVEIMKLLIDALDMFLVGTALLTFGMGLYTMFYGSQKLKGGASITSITQAKTRIGHAIVLLLQAGILEEFKSVPLVSGLDTACFAGAVLASAAGVFLLSKLT